MKKFIKIATVLSVVTIFCLSLFVQNASAQSNIINTGVTINKMTDYYGYVFAGTPSFPVTLNFSGGSVAGEDLLMTVYVMRKLDGGGINKVATLSFNANSNTRECIGPCYPHTIPVPTSKWTSTTSFVLPGPNFIYPNLEPGTYSVRVAIYSRTRHANMIPGPGVTKSNTSGLEAYPIPVYEVGTFVVATPCTADINSHYQLPNSGYLDTPQTAILQSILKTKGLYERSVNGVYDSYTSDVVKKYQKSIGLAETGVLDYNGINTINKYCNEQVTPVITRITKLNSNGVPVEASSARTGEIITIEGRNFFPKKDLGKTSSRSSVVEFGPYFTYPEPISIEPTKIVVRARMLNSHYDSYVSVRNNGVYSNKVPFVVENGNYAFNEPEITKINDNDSMTPDARQRVITVSRGETITIKGKDFNLGNVKKVRFVNTGSLQTDVTAVLLSLTSTEATVVVPNNLYKTGTYYIQFTDESGVGKGNNAVILIAGIIDPAIENIKEPVAPGAKVQIKGYNFFKELDLYITNGSREYRLSQTPDATDSQWRATFILPNNIAAGNYNMYLKSGNGINDGTSNTASMTVGILDTIKPSVPTEPLIARFNANTIKLYWTASTDNVGVKGYRVYRDNFPVQTALNNTLFIEGVSPTSKAVFSVAAFDGAGNISDPSVPVQTDSKPAPVLISVTPNSGIANDLITISGTNLVSVFAVDFDNASKLLLVLPNSSTMQLTPAQFTDTQLQTILPPDLTPGNYGIRVWTISGISNTLNFKVNPRTTVTPPASVVRKSPMVTSVTPGSGKAGDKIVISGNHFYTDGVTSSNRISEVVLTNSNSVTVARATIVSESNTKVEVLLPSNLNGYFNVVVVTTRGEKTNPWTIRINTPTTVTTTPAAPVTLTPPAPAAPATVITPAPRITSVLPVSVKAGDTVTLYGTNFTGVIGDLISISNSNGSVSPEVVYTVRESSVVFKMPNVPAGTYNVELTANSGTSNKITINVLASAQVATPYISSISPSSAKYNANVTITGTNLEGATSDLLFIENPSIGAMSLEIVSASATSITFRVPNIPAGTYKVYLFADKGESNEVNFTVQSSVSNRQGLLQTASVIGWFLSIFVR